MKRIVRCINCKWFCDKDNTCRPCQGYIKYPYANTTCFGYIDKEEENDVQRDHNKGT